MKRILLSAVCVFAFCAPAQSQIAVTDTASLVQQIKAYLVQAKGLATQAQQYAAQVQQLHAEIETLEAFVHSPSLGAAMGVLQQTGLSNDLPVSPYAVQSLVSGQTGLIGKIGALGSLSNGAWAANHIYSPTDGGFASQQLINSSNSIAGTQGASEAAYASLRAHMPVIQALRNTLMTATDPKTVADATAQLQAEGVWTASLNAQLASIQVASQAQAASREQQADEWMDKALDDHMAALTAAGRGL